MKVFYEGRAALDLENIADWIAKDAPRSANRVILEIIASIDQLTVFPKLGRLGVIPETRQLVVPRLPYIVIYRFDAERDIVVVMAIFHASQDRPNWRG